MTNPVVHWEIGEGDATRLRAFALFQDPEGNLIGLLTPGFMPA